jgi:hypothetical protein
MSDPKKLGIQPPKPPRSPKVRPRSLVLVNTGEGKGKSTAAFGVVMRARAREWRVCVIQFIKSDKWKVGEEKIARELTALLVAHGTAAQMPLLETIVGDVHRNNAARRAQATAAIAELTPEGVALPACVVELLTSGRPELRRAGVQAIGKVKPRDESLIRHLREIAAAGGQLGRESTQVI